MYANIGSANEITADPKIVINPQALGLFMHEFD